MKVVVSIVNYKTEDLTKKCLESLLNKKWKNEVEIWVVDNNSDDGSLENLKKTFPKVNFIESKVNVGFGAGHNLALKKAKYDLAVILNSDTIIEEMVIDKMIDFMEENPDCGIASCKVLGFDGCLQPNAGDLPFGLSLINWLFNFEVLGIKRPAFHVVDDNYYQSKKEVGWVSGNFMIIRKKALEKVGPPAGGFDENYFMYFEDVELCYRIKQAGYKVMLNPETTIKHLSGGSLDNPKLRQWTGEYKGLVYFYKSQFGELTGFLIKVFVYKAIILRIIAFFLIGKYDFSKTYAKVITRI